MGGSGSGFRGYSPGSGKPPSPAASARRTDQHVLRPFPTAHQQVHGLALVHLGQRGLEALEPRDLDIRSEEHTSELQSQSNLVCRLLLEKKKKKYIIIQMLE